MTIRTEEEIFVGYEIRDFIVVHTQGVVTMSYFKLWNFKNVFKNNDRIHSPQVVSVINEIIKK